MWWVYNMRKTYSKIIIAKKMALSSIAVYILAWENSRHSLRHHHCFPCVLDIWETSTEFPYWSGKHQYPDLGSALRWICFSHFAGKPAVSRAVLFWMSRNVAWHKKKPKTRSPKTTAKLIHNNVYCFFITIFRLVVPAFFRFTDVTGFM